ncbi:hypothetical protein Cgig2_014456 [Carnegiea gigantea]|uniref:DNA-directed RNA polymerase III subunit RPC6 n=1 Tax=Carnegiea gigantea TaxID=171969 RepID=A0A9Q1QEY3_9CARY|nr:hypothetical protein Cgig2_014456 [Carnegiea gigantea]
MGIVKTDITKELKMTIPKVTNSIKSLQTKQMIKEVPDIQCKGKKRLLAAEFEPSKDLTGGVWYDNGRLDTHLIETLKQVSLKALADQKIATPDGIRHFLNRVMTGDLTVDQVKEILDNLILEKKIVKVRSNGLGEFAAFPMGADCYKLKQREEKVGAMASIPCEICTVHGSEGTLLSEHWVSVKEESMSIFKDHIANCLSHLLIFLRNNLRAFQEGKMKSETSQTQETKMMVFV